MRWAAIGLAALMALGGCSASEDVASAERGIATFHEKLNSGHLDAIYDEAGPEMKKAAARSDLILLLSAVQRKLGHFKSGKVATWNDNATTNGHFVTLNYSAQYDRGVADENFVYRLDGQNALLVGYHVQSTAFLLN